MENTEQIHETHIMPTVHSNGTSADELVDMRCAAIDALNEAGSALAKMSPNGRDYYTHPVTGALECATVRHDDRIKKLKSIIEDLYAEVEHIQI